MPLFNVKTVATALAAYDREPTAEEIEVAARWAAQAAEDFGGQNESQLEPELNALLMQRVLGYRALGPDGAGTIKAKQPLGPGTVDLALGHFTSQDARVLAPFELKGPKVGLDAIMPGRAKTPVQQAWEYANDAIGARWVLVSNMREVRLYAIGHGRADFESFDLRRIADPAELRRLQLFLHAENFLGGATADLLARSATEDRDITGKLYADYTVLRTDLLQFVRDSRPAIEAERRITLIQKLLDRLIFVAFAEDSVLMPDDSIKQAVTFVNRYDPQPKWRQVCALFSAVNDGHPRSLGIDAYNGGLFAPDPELDGLDLPDHLVERFLDISDYDFKSQISVTILGHIFEQSISDIEAMQAEARGEEPPKAGKRKRDGVVYTPDFVTRFIVERTIGAHLHDVAGVLLSEHAAGHDAEGAIRWRSRTAERDHWRAYLDRLTGLRVVDPACGSGAFLIAAFDYLHAEQRRVRERLGELDGGILAWADPNSDIEIITRNLYGVDVNAESVEITRLSLWLKTAKKGRPLESLDLNIRCGNSLIEDSDFHSRAFVWERDFPGGAFDIVIGNPPYVRMELLKPIKPYLERRYAVVSDRADLYAYFFELGIRVLKPGGRLGYITSSTFFRTGSGAPLRTFLSEQAEIEAVVDFGDLQLFEGVTTYPAIVIARKAAGGEGDLRFLNLKALPADLSLTFAENAEAMPRARLTPASWRLEGDRLDAIRRKMAAGRPTLAEIYGAPLYGIKTGLNEAFVLSRATRDALIARDPASTELLKPFLIGENLKRWHVESDDLWLIYTPKNRVDIEAYPGLRDHLLPFRDKLEARATRQNWWELQQAQAAYAPRFEAPKIMYPSISQGPKFSRVRSGVYGNDKTFMIGSEDLSLMAFLGSKCSWMTLFGDASPLRGGHWRLELREQYMSRLPLPSNSPDFGQTGFFGQEIQNAHEGLALLITEVVRRLADISPAIPTVSAFRFWPNLPFAQLRALIVKRCRTDIAPSERDDWERWYEGRRTEASALRGRIVDAEAEINERVYALFGLDPDEIAAIDDSLAGQY